jgi:hypothetical protein
MITGLPSIITSVSLFPLVLTTTIVFPDALGVGVSRSAVMMSLLPSILAVIAMSASVVKMDRIISKFNIHEEFYSYRLWHEGGENADNEKSMMPSRGGLPLNKTTQ